MEATRSHVLDGLVTRAISLNDVLEDQLELEGRTFRVRVRSAEGGAVLVFQDVTELLRLTRARRDMVANISHELRTPISTIRLLIDTVRQRIDRGQPIEDKQIRKIAAEVDSIQTLVQELHDLSMIESGRAIMRLIDIPIDTLVHDALSRMAEQIDKKKLTTTNTIPADMVVLADPDQMRRVLLNLVGNAVKFTPSGGSLSLSAERKGGQFVVRIADSGPGIPPQDRMRVFERFFQLDSSRGTHGGSGLGLAIAKHIIEAQGGTIWVEGVEPHGACLCFTLNAADERNDASELSVSDRISTAASDESEKKKSKK